MVGAEQTIPASVMDAMAACRTAAVDVRDRDRVLHWLVYSGHREAARWLVLHPADYGCVIEALPYWEIEASA